MSRCDWSGVEGQRTGPVPAAQIAREDDAPVRNTPREIGAVEQRRFDVVIGGGQAGIPLAHALAGAGRAWRWPSVGGSAARA